jgi:hypothetical protein
LRVLTLRQTEDTADTTPAISSNYVQLQVLRKLSANEWVNVLISERENKIVGEMESSMTAGAVLEAVRVKLAPAHSS